MISIGFEFPNYTYAEEDNEITYAIGLQKSGLAERVVAADVSLTGTMTASQGEDFNITATIQTIFFQPDEQSKDYFVTIRPDVLSEEVESFTLTASATPGFILNRSHIPETTIFITNDDGMFMCVYSSADVLLNVISYLGLWTHYSSIVSQVQAFQMIVSPLPSMLSLHFYGICSVSLYTPTS